jgi:peptide/nickel transport system ATP-binding protein
VSALLLVSGVTVRFRGWGRASSAITNVSLQVARGEALGLVGASGSGKSTLARVMTGLLPPTLGTVHFDGVDLGCVPARERRGLCKRLQPVFQDAGAALDPRRTIDESLAEPFEIQANVPREELSDRVGALLATVGLERVVGRRLPRALSAGQRQRAVLARALALQPELLVLDEPTSALDVSAQAQVLNVLLELKRQAGLAMVLISHDAEVVGHLADRLVVLEEGRVRAEGTFDAAQPGGGP